MFFTSIDALAMEAERSYDAWHQKQGRKVTNYLARKLGVGARMIKFAPFYRPQNPEDPQNPKEVKNIVVRQLLEDPNIPEPIRVAIKLADFFHKGGERKFVKSKEPGTPKASYLCHPLLVASILARTFNEDVSHGKMDQRRYFRLIIAGLLHDAKEEYKGAENVEEKIRRDLGPAMMEFFGRETGLEETNAIIKIVLECSKDAYPEGMKSKEEKREFKKAFVKERFGNEKNSSEDAVIVKATDLLANAKEVDEEIELEIKEIYKELEKSFKGYVPSSTEQKFIQEQIGSHALSQPEVEKVLKRQDYEKHLHPILVSRKVPEAKSILKEAWQIISKEVGDIKHQWENALGAKSHFRSRFNGQDATEPQKPTDHEKA